jgi:hypothetical protein
MPRDVEFRPQFLAVLAPSDRSFVVFLVLTQLEAAVFLGYLFDNVIFRAKHIHYEPLSHGGVLRFGAINFQLVNFNRGFFNFCLWLFFAFSFTFLLESGFGTLADSGILVDK